MRAIWKDRLFQHNRPVADSALGTGQRCAVPLPVADSSPRPSCRRSATTKSMTSTWAVRRGTGDTRTRQGIDVIAFRATCLTGPAFSRLQVTWWSSRMPVTTLRRSPSPRTVRHQSWRLSNRSPQRFRFSRRSGACPPAAVLAVGVNTVARAAERKRMSGVPCHGPVIGL